MRKLLLILLMATIATSNVKAQASELAQLALNVEKLAQLKSILTTLKKGYQIVSKGYGAVKDISEGSFSIHRTFLDGLMQVSPAVKKYRKVGGIINYQIMLIKEYKPALQRFKKSNWFHPDELRYIGNIYENLLNNSLKNLDELATVITANQLRMTDDERLTAIDRIYAEMEDKVLFLRHFNSSTSILAVQRAKEGKEIERMNQIYGLDKN